MGDVHVREATQEDVGDIVRIAERAWRDAYGEILSSDTIDAAMAEWYDPQQTREFVEDEDVAYFVAERDGAILGYVSGGPTEAKNVASLGAIYVDPDAWGEGIGTALLEEFEAFCRCQGVTEVRFRVLAENDVGIGFYRNHGYEAIEESEVDLFGESVKERRFRGPVE